MDLSYHSRSTGCRLAVSRVVKPRVVSMKTVVLCVMMVITSSTSVHAASCTGFGGVLKGTWEQVYKVAHPIGKQALTLIPIVGQNKAAVEAISQASSKFHNFVFNGNRQSWATVGARELPVLDEQIRQFGRLVKAGVGGARVYTTAGLFWDKVVIEIEKLDGKAKTEVIICTWDMESGAKNNYTEYMFPNGKKLSKKKFVINNVHGKSISIKLRNRSVANTFKYSIKSRGFLDLNKQKARGKRHGAVNTNSKSKKHHKKFRKRRAR
ncbi:MAG: hypothetical protein ACPGYT_06885 [Nitrospirales bacterium]